MNNDLTMDALVFISEQENALLERMKKYITENKKLIAMGLIMMGGNYRECHTYSKMQHK